MSRLNNFSMNKHIHTITITLIATIFSFYTSYAQCNINTGCAANAVFSVNAPVFNSANASLTFGNVTFGEINCNSANFKSGIVIYIYQLMPDGNRTFQCTVEGPTPFNVIGNIAADFGQNVDLCGSNFNIGNIVADSSNGFEPCDGARLESEAILYVTQNINFNANNSSVYNQLQASEYITVNLGTTDINISNQFPGNGQPLTTAIINDFATGSNGPITLNCGEDIELYVEGLSRLANCVPYGDISSGIPSELENKFYYSINGAAPVIIRDSSNGAMGGQLTGPDPSLAGLCYAGILNDNNPYVLSYTDIANTVCEGDEIIFTIETTDLFTNVTVQDQITIIYSGGNCSTTNCCAAVDLNLNFDNLPGQTSWEILDASNSVVASGGGYGSLGAYANTAESTCLIDGCYTLVMYDSIGNGMCPFQSSAIGVSTFITPGTLITPGSIVGTFSLIATPGLCGSYNLTDANGTPLVNGGGSFGSTQTNTFCLNNGLSPKHQNFNTSHSKLNRFDFDLQPNPATNFVKVELNTALLRQSENVELSVLDISGKLLIKQMANNPIIDLGNLEAGYYLMKVTANEFTATKKFLKD